MLETVTSLPPNIGRRTGGLLTVSLVVPSPRPPTMRAPAHDAGVMAVPIPLPDRASPCVESIVATASAARGMTSEPLTPVARVPPAGNTATPAAAIAPIRNVLANVADHPPGSQPNAQAHPH